MAKHAAPSRRRRILKRLLLAAAVVVPLTLAGTVGYLVVNADKISKEITKITGLHHILPAPKHGADKATVNVLLIGSTDRCALKVQNPAYGLCQNGVDGINSDIIMVLHLDPNRHRVSVLSIPRDLLVPNARAEGANKIDAGLVESPDQLIAAVEEDFGIPIQHFAELNFETFANVVNDLGGVRMYFPMPVFDAESGLHIWTAGCHALNGIQALEVVRARHLQYDPPGGGYALDYPRSWPQDPLSDLSRIRRTHEFLRVLAAAVSHRGLGNPFTDESLLADVAPQLQVDSTLSTRTMVDWALTYHGVNPYTSVQLTLPVMVDASYNYQYEGYDLGNVEFPDEPVDQNAIDSVLDVNADTDTMTGLPLPAPSTVKVAVLGGSGVAGQAATTAEQLRRDGYVITGTTDVQPVGPESETLVEYHSHAPSIEAAAERVARSLRGAVVMDYAETPPGADVAVVTGSDFSVVVPPAAPPTSSTTATTTPTTGATTTTTVSATTSTTAPAAPTNTGSDELDPPSPATSPLAPFDPRSCTPSGGEGP